MMPAVGFPENLPPIIVLCYPLLVKRKRCQNNLTERID